MNRFEIEVDADRLTITRPAPAGRMVIGFALLCFTLACLTPIGVLGVIQDRSSSRGPLTVAPDALGFTDPHANHFGFLWLVGIGVVTVAIPLFSLHIYRAGTVFVFDRITGRFTRNGRALARLGQIEAIRVARTGDSDDRALFHLMVVHNEGFEVELDEWYDEAEIRVVAREIADWTHVPITGVPAGEVEPLELVPNDPWRWS